jgi:4'-phosphopantetheinyl transferase
METLMAVATNWSRSPDGPRCGQHEVHVWRASLDCDHAVLQALEATLSLDERARASRFVFARDRDRFVAGRGILRSILGQYTNRPETSLEFVYEPEGKPRLDLLDSDPPIRFNVSHSQNVAVYAVSERRELGIDVEAIRPDVIGEELAERFFSSRELAEFRSLPPEQRQEGFFLCWTRKEAYVKARGSGLGIPLDSFDVSLTPGRAEQLIAADAARWTVRSFHPADGYVGAVVAGGGSWNLQLFEWDATEPLSPLSRTN